jgi:hypothetical protein
VDGDAYVFITSHRDSELASAVKEIGRENSGCAGRRVESGRSRTSAEIILFERIEASKLDLGDRNGAGRTLRDKEDIPGLPDVGLEVDPPQALSRESVRNGSAKPRPSSISVSP